MAATTPQAIYQALVAEGLEPVAAAALAQIAQRESGFRPDAFNGNTSTGDESYGLFQINLLHGGWAPFLEAQLGWPAGEVASRLQTFDGSIKAVAAIYRHSGLNPWGGYKGVGWNHGTNIQTGVAASGGAVTAAQLESFQGYNSGGNTPGLGTAPGSNPGGASPTDSTGIDPATYQQYAYLANDPEIGALLRESNTMSNAEFLARVQETNWWRTHSGSARAWAQLKSTDPASYDQQFRTYTRQIVETAQQLGVGLDIGTLAKLANQWGAENWTPQDATNAILGYAQPGHAKAGLAFGQEQVRQAAASYGIKLTDPQAFDYEQQIARNQLTANGLNANFAQQAERMFPHLKPELDQGFTLQQLATPYINTAASTLEIDPSRVDLSDPKWARALAFHDGKTVRQMTNYEWTQTLMSDPTYGYRATQNGQGAAVGLATNMDKIFGVGIGA